MCACSPLPQERLGGVLAIDELIDVKVMPSSQEEQTQYVVSSEPEGSVSIA